MKTKLKCTKKALETKYLIHQDTVIRGLAPLTDRWMMTQVAVAASCLLDFILANWRPELDLWTMFVMLFVLFKISD